jgi:hypothetical protein
MPDYAKHLFAFDFRSGVHYQLRVRLQESEFSAHLVYLNFLVVSLAYDAGEFDFLLFNDHLVLFL